jgi:tRNA A-37 threonylcarbamoyl transferase component Bud32
LVAKKPVRIAWHKRILDRKKPSKSLRSWNGTSELQRRGIQTPKVVAYFEHQDRTQQLGNWFICEHANTHLSVRSFFISFSNGEETVEGFTFEVFSEQLIDFIRTMHWRGVYFRDLSGGNVLIRIEENNRLVFSLIDTARARFSNQRFSRSKRIADLKRLVHKLDSQRQAHFMGAYLKQENAHFTAYHRFSFRLYAFKASLKRIKRKLRKKLYSGIEK